MHKTYANRAAGSLSNTNILRVDSLVFPNTKKDLLANPCWARARTKKKKDTVTQCSSEPHLFVSVPVYLLTSKPMTSTGGISTPSSMWEWLTYRLVLRVMKSGWLWPGALPSGRR